MYNNPYEEYMRNSLGYNQMPMMNMNQMNMNQMNMNPMTEMYEAEGNFTCNQTSVDDMYPEIYRIIYPMICKVCMAVNENVTEDLVSRITNEVYMNVEHMEVAQETRSSVSKTSISPASKSVKNDSLNNRTSSNSTLSNVRQQETRQQNPLLRDLIRILVLRELIGNPGRPTRPPFSGPGRPPFGPGQRPPYMF